MVHSIASQDIGQLIRLFSTPVIFRSVTPNRFWDADTPIGVSDIVLGAWFGPDKSITAVTSIETDSVGDVQKVRYRMTVDLESGPSVIEQVAYYSQRDGKITEMRLLCSGFRPL
jgi:hypothetical protein